MGLFANFKPFGTSASQPRNRRHGDVVAFRQLLERRTFGTAAARLCLLHGIQLGRSPHVLAACFGAAASFSRAGADQVPLYVGQSAKDGDHQPPRAGARVGPRLRQRTKLSARVADLLHDRE